MKEVWKDVPGFEGIYQVSNMGRVKTLAKLLNTWNGGRMSPEKILMPKIQKSGYAHIGLWRNQKCKQVRVHRLVALLFCENDSQETKTQVNHINEDKLDNRAENLEWVTPKKNTNHGSCIKKRIKKRKSANHHFVVQIDKDTGDVIAVFKNERQASLFCGRDSHGEIGKVCNGKQKTAYGYKWAYATGGDGLVADGK